MACGYMSDYNHNDFCDGVGGVEKWYVFSTRDEEGNLNVEFEFDSENLVASVSLSTNFDGEVDVYEWIVEQETSTLTDTAVDERTAKSRSREQQATVVFHGDSDVLTAEIDKMTGRYTLIAKDNRGLYRVMFMTNGGQILDEFTTGTTFDEQYAHTLTISGKEVKKAPIISQEILEAILGLEHPE